jgi:imidazolonepropionase-like amidohydrolase
VGGVRLPDGEPISIGIDAAGRWTSTPDGAAEVLPGRYLLAGLVDAHCHLSVASGADGWPVALDADGARRNLAAARACGVTAIRDTGSPGSVTLGLLGDENGLLACGRFLAPSGQYFPALHTPVPAEDLVDAALAEVARGARWVKLVGDFPVLSPDGPPGPAQPTYAMADVRLLVEAVHAAGARVAAHTTTRRVTELIAAGVDSIEHGTELTEDDVAELAARGGAWTPTLCASVGPRVGADAERERRVAAIRERLGHLLPRAAALGVTVMAGTDVVGSVHREVALLIELGLPPAGALAAASTSARAFLGLADFQPHQPADVVAYDQDPREDPEVLARPAAVVARGRRLL